MGRFVFKFRTENVSICDETVQMKSDAFNNTVQMEISLLSVL